MQQQARQAFGRVGMDMLSGDGLLGTDLQKLLADKQEKLKKNVKKAEVSESDGEDDAADGEGSVGEKLPDPPAKPSKGWDAETKTIKAEKDYERSHNSYKKGLDETVTEMTDCLAEFKCEPNRKVWSRYAPSLQQRTSPKIRHMHLVAPASCSLSPTLHLMSAHEVRDLVQGAEQCQACAGDCRCHCQCRLG